MVGHQHVREGDQGTGESYFNPQSLSIGTHVDSTVEAPLFQDNPGCNPNLEVQSSLCCSSSNDGSPCATMDPPSWVRPIEEEDGMAQMDSEDGSEVTPTC